MQACPMPHLSMMRCDAMRPPFQRTKSISKEKERSRGKGRREKKQNQEQKKVRPLTHHHAQLSPPCLGGPASRWLPISHPDACPYRQDKQDEAARLHDDRLSIRRKCGTHPGHPPTGGTPIRPYQTRPEIALSWGEGRGPTLSLAGELTSATNTLRRLSEHWAGQMR